MREHQRFSAGWVCLLLLLAGEFAVTAQSNVQSAGTCASRTVNYITHSLPQQCHKSSWSSPTAPIVDATESPSNSVESVAVTNPISTSTEATDSISTTIASTSIETPNDSTTDSSTDQEASQQTIPSPSSTSGGIDLDSDSDSDAGSALGNENFLSFEEWKRQNLAKLGQSVEHIGKKQPSSNEDRKRPSNIHNSLDSLGDDAEIDLNFGGFAAETPESRDATQWRKLVDDDSDEHPEGEEASPRVTSRNRDAGTTCKERFNYASFDCAATVLKTNPQASGAVSVLIEKNRDSYMLNECSANNKFIILELCDDIAIDTVVLANFEFFSSTFRTFTVSVSDRYPVKLDKWKTLGTYEARNSREIQAFLVENPMIWARYLRIEFLTHYGDEFYCPVSLIRVHGTTMMEDYKHDEVAARAEDDEEQEEGALEAEVGEKISPDAVAQPILDEQAGKASSIESKQQEQTPTLNATSIENEPGAIPTDFAHTTSPYNEMARNDLLVLLEQPAQTCPLLESSKVTAQAVLPTSQTAMETSKTTEEAGHQNANATTASTSQPTGGTPASSSESLVSNSYISDDSIDVTSTAPSKTTSSFKSSQSSPQDNGKASSSSTQPHAANPTIQESFFKSVQKRLQMLESNSSLSLQYIEEQSRILRDAFSKVEQKQLTKTTNFLDYLNSTVLHELRDFRQQYDQIWQSTVIELETQREQYQREVLAMNTRLGILADEVIFQKRMSILQSILVLLCLGLVLFSRGALNTYLELPIVQNVMARSQSFKMPTMGWDTPSGGSPVSTTTQFSSLRHKPRFNNMHQRHQRDSSDDIPDATSSIGPEVSYTPPTPTSQQYNHDDDDDGDDILVDDGESEVDQSNIGDYDDVPDHSTIQRPQSSPGVLTTSAIVEDALPPLMNGHRVTSLLSNQSEVTRDRLLQED